MDSKLEPVDLLIVGGGVLGTFHAYHAQRRGLRAILTERHAAPQDASVRNFGQVVPSGLNAAWQAFGRESLRIYQEIQTQFDISVRQQGSIYIASDEDELTLINELYDINRNGGYTSQLLTPKQCRNRYSQLRKSYCRGGLYFPEEISVNPRQMIHRLHAFLATQRHIQCHFNTFIVSLDTRDKGEVLAIASNGRRFAARQVIICNGAEFRALYPEQFADSDLEIVKLQMLRLKPQQGVVIPGNVLTGLSIRRYESFSECPSWNRIKRREPTETFWKRWGVHLLFKQEADGGIILGDSHEYIDLNATTPWNFDVRADVNQYFIDEGQKIFELPHWEIESTWTGVYSQTKATQSSGIYTQKINEHIHIVTGIGGKGMTSSAGFARKHLDEIFNDD